MSAFGLTLGSMNEHIEPSFRVIRSRAEQATITVEDLHWVAACYCDDFAMQAFPGALSPPAGGLMNLSPGSAAAAKPRAYRTSRSIIDVLTERWEPVNTLIIGIVNPHNWSESVDWTAADRPLPDWFSDVDEVRIEAYSGPHRADPLNSDLPLAVRDGLIYLACLYGGHVTRTPDNPHSRVYLWDLPGGGHPVDPVSWHPIDPSTVTPPDDSDEPGGVLINAVSRFTSPTW